MAAARSQLVAFNFAPSAELSVIGFSASAGLLRRVFRIAYLHVRQPYLERAEDLFDERTGPPVEFGVPRSFSGLGDMFFCREFAV